VGSPEKLTAVAGAVGKVKIPLQLRDFQVQWESPAFGLAGIEVGRAPL